MLAGCFSAVNVMSFFYLRAFAALREMLFGRA
jgi:hypothetical protein